MSPTAKGKREHYVYRVHDSQGRCLYVGRTMNPNERWRSHCTSQPWKGEASEVAFYGPYTLGVAASKEAEAIWVLRPGYNLALNQYAGAARTSELNQVEAEAMWDLMRLGLSLDEAQLVMAHRRERLTEAWSAPSSARKIATAVTR